MQGAGDGKPTPLDDLLPTLSLAPGADLSMWQGFFEMIDQPICVCDREGHLVSWNRAALRLWGREPDGEDRWCGSRGLTDTQGQRIDPEHLPSALAVKQGQALQVDGMVSIRPDGTRRRFQVWASPIRDAENQIAGAIACTRELFEPQDQALTRGRLTAIVQTSDDAIISTDLTGAITSWNEGARRLYGYTADEVIGRPSSLLVPADRNDEEPEVLARIRCGDAVDHYETFRRRKDGSEVAVSLSVSPLLDEQGVAIGAAKIARDVSDRQTADLVQNRLAAIVESSDDAIISKDLNGVIVTWNRGAEQLFGYTADEVIGKPITLLIPADRLSEEPHVLGKIVRGESIKQFETVRCHRDGSLLDISLTVSPIRNRQGLVVGASKFARDISARKRVERRLADADRRKDEFLATLSHELRNPLAPLRTNLEILQGGAADPVVHSRLVEVMTRQVDHLVRLVDDLLEVSRISRGVIPLDKQVLSLAELVRDAVEMSRPLLEAHHQHMGLSIPDALLPVFGDRVRLVQVFTNLLNNAAKFSTAGGHVGVKVEPDGSGGVVIRVIDQGIGIEPDDLDAVFEMFTRVGRSTSQVAGLGVGLSLVRQLVQMHGGSVQAISEGSGRGTEMRIRLPLYAPAVDQSQTREPQRPAAPPRISQRLLVVDDNRDAADAMAMLLGTMGHETHVAYNGAQALSQAESLRPDIILLDIGLPDMSGYDVAAALRGCHWTRELRVIALTGWGQAGDRARTKAAGFDLHLVKPVDLETLRNLVDAPSVD